MLCIPLAQDYQLIASHTEPFAIKVILVMGYFARAADRGDLCQPFHGFIKNRPNDQLPVGSHMPYERGGDARRKF